MIGKVAFEAGASSTVVGVDHRSKAKQVCNRFIISQNTRSFLCCLLRHRHLLLAMPMPTTRAAQKHYATGQRVTSRLVERMFGGETSRRSSRDYSTEVWSTNHHLTAAEQASGCGVGKVVLSHCCAKRGRWARFVVSQDVNFKIALKLRGIGVGETSGREGSALP